MFMASVGTGQRADGDHSGPAHVDEAQLFAVGKGCHIGKRRAPIAVGGFCYARGNICC
jgi:hypothetical protein